MRDIKKSTHILILSVIFFTETVWFVTFFYNKKKWNGIVAMTLPNRREKNLFQLVFGNTIAEIEGKKKLVGMNLWQWYCRNR